RVGRLAADAGGADDLGDQLDVPVEVGELPVARLAQHRVGERGDPGPRRDLDAEVDLLLRGGGGAQVALLREQVVRPVVVARPGQRGRRAGVQAAGPGRDRVRPARPAYAMPAESTMARRSPSARQAQRAGGTTYQAYALRLVSVMLPPISR